MFGYIYSIVVSGYGIYYGETTSISKRWWKHNRMFKSGRHHNIKLRYAYNYLGSEAFKFNIISGSEVLGNTKLRLYEEKILIRANPLCLNIKDNPPLYFTKERSPPNPIYYNRKVHVKRIQNTNFILIKDIDGSFIGVEQVNSKFMLGTFTIDNNGLLTRGIK